MSFRSWHLRVSSVVVVAVGALAIVGCRSEPEKPPPPDPRLELARHNDEYWAYLRSTYDRDGDGRVERTEYTRGDDSFARLDRDHDGELTRADLDRELVLPPNLVAPMLLIRLSGGPDAKSAAVADVEASVKKLDANGDGRVDRAEYERGARPWQPGVDSFATLLVGLDADHDGLLSTTEVEQWLAHRDADGDGVLVLRERTQTGTAPREGFIEPADREPAPDFLATSLESAKPISLSSKVGPRPIALIFGSFT